MSVPTGNPTAERRSPQAAQGTLLRLSQITKEYRSDRGKVVRALHEVSLDVRQGEILAIIGASGCGKSTLLRIMAGLDTITSGQTEWSRRPTPGRDIGYVFQEPVLLPWRSVLRNACIAPETLKEPRQRYEPRVRELLSLVGLTDFADALPRELSGGMRQRTSIVRALAHDPMLLLMDEPFGALDQITREKLHDDLLNIWTATGKTIVFVTHSVDEATYLADRVVVLSPRPGRVRAIHDVPLPRPRDARTKLDPRFAEFQAMLRGEL
ncbi:ABC transporter ATP-binding protein [Micromonospora sp. NPDC048063]|uniref:ABC transporter ATP-binding protein n=1 Tax=Micromonospora sp. NPDC048063 TaxID=3364256 RepID=UPI003721BED8